MSALRLFDPAPTGCGVELALWTVFPSKKTKCHFVKEHALSEQPLLQLVGVSKRFGAVQALYKVDFEAKNGEVMALVGDNGAGKSTLIKGIAGIYSFDEGQTLFNGQEVHIRTPHDSASLGIEVVYQDLALAD